MADANFAFLARQLLQTELRGQAWTDRAGGAYAAGERLWAALWDPAASGDPEKFVQETEAKAKELGLPFAGLIVLTSPAAESDPALTALEEALYVYGYPRRQGLGLAGPDMVQVLAKPPFHKPLPGLEIGPAEAQNEQVIAMLQEAWAEKDGLGGPGWSAVEELQGDGIAHLLARRGGTAVGVVSLNGVGVTGRIVLAWVKPEARGAGIGKHLLAAAAKHSTDGGQLVLSAWTHRDGRLRYYFAQEGYADQLRVVYFYPEK